MFDLCDRFVVKISTEIELVELLLVLFVFWVFVCYWCLLSDFSHKSTVSAISSTEANRIGASWGKSFLSSMDLFENLMKPVKLEIIHGMPHICLRLNQILKAIWLLKT